MLWLFKNFRQWMFEHNF